MGQQHSLRKRIGAFVATALFIGISSTAWAETVADDISRPSSDEAPDFPPTSSQPNGDGSSAPIALDSDRMITGLEAEARRLRLKSRRQLASAIGLYVWGGSFTSFGIAVAAGDCSDENDSFGFCEGFKPAISAINIGTGLIPILGAALPLHFAAKRNRATAAALESGALQSFSRELYRGPYLARAGRRSLYASAGLGVVAITSGIVSARAEAGTTREERNLLLSGYASAGTLFAATLGTGMLIRGNRLEERGLAARPVQATVAPLFLGDGAGLSLWMGF